MRALREPVADEPPHPLESPGFRSRLSGATTALDAARMAELLQGALLGRNAGHNIERCEVTRALYLPRAERCHLVYRLELRDAHSSTLTTRVVSARLFASHAACQEYLRRRLAPLGRLVRGRKEMAPFVAPLATLEPHMLVSVFPVDGDLPALVAATDAHRMSDLFGKLLPGTSGAEPPPACRVELVRYPARKRCVLRYEVAGRPPRAERAEPWVVYGKVHEHVPDSLATRAMLALAERVQGQTEGAGLRVPRPILHGGAPQLALLEAIPGQARTLRRLLKQRRRGIEDRPGRLTLEDLLDACASAASLLHGSRIALGGARSLHGYLRRLRAGIQEVEPLAPAFAQRLLRWYEPLERHAQRSRPLDPCFSHGDFNHSQFVFDGSVGGLVDFDSLCQAEPARDVGRFLAYLRVAVRRVDANAPASFTEALRERFLAAYVAARRNPREGLDALRARVDLYEASTLLDLTLRSWLKFKPRRLAQASEILDSLEIMPGRF